MIYPYECTTCDNAWEVAKPLRAIDDEELCTCGEVGRRTISRFGSIDRTSASDWNNVHYNPAFGRSFTSNREARKEAKRKGFIEVGDEPVDKIHKKFDGERQQKLDSSYDSLGLTDLGNIKS